MSKGSGRNEEEESGIRVEDLVEGVEEKSNEGIGREAMMRYSMIGLGIAWRTDLRAEDYERKAWNKREIQSRQIEQLSQDRLSFDSKKKERSLKEILKILWVEDVGGEGGEDGKDIEVDS